MSSIGTRVGLICRLSSAALKLARVQNLIAHSPSGGPSGVTPRLECIRRPQRIELAPIITGVAAGILPDHADRLGPDPVIGKLGGVVEDEDRPLGRSQAAGGCREWPARISASLTRSLSKKR